MKKRKRSAADVSSAELEPKAPEIVAKVEWLRRNWRRHWIPISCAPLFAFAGWLVSTSTGLQLLKRTTDSLVKIKIEQAVKALRSDYPQARDSLSQGTGDFAKVEADIAVIKKLDSSNGTVLYYSGEVQRIKNGSLFTPKSCLIKEKLAKDPQALDAYQNDFRRYIDIEKTLPESQSRGNYSAEACYQRNNGYCSQRTAWIHHLLANDFYAEAMLETNPRVRADKVKRALGHAKAAAEMYKDERKQPGFDQCVATTVIISEAENELKQ